ncbi:hypothetical protein D7003_18945 [Arthrobacter oryzae]|uniref:Lipoprotein n=1 Tax=Arthrobacter oryzae TaxID=409290 RepID=A0A3N0BL55_9MICC|nr:hypothetical protein D7003_18945 [Arthrobacter oryzae]
MSGRGGTKHVRCYAAGVLSFLIAGCLAGCAFGGAGDAPSTASTEPSGEPAPIVPTKGLEIRDIEAGNYTELEKRLAVARGLVILDDSGPVDGPEVGFRATATVSAAGAYTVTAACVGLPDAQIFVARPGSSAERLAFDLDCSGVLSQVIELQEGYVVAGVTRRDPTGPWTGAVAGVRITVE